MVTIAVDAMGGDHFPKPEVEGALQAAKAFGVRVILVGREDLIQSELDKHSGWASLPIEIRHAPERVTMEDSAGKAVRAACACAPHDGHPALTKLFDELVLAREHAPRHIFLKRHEIGLPSVTMRVSHHHTNRGPRRRDLTACPRLCN